MTQPQKLYFPALDGLRFVAFLLVFFHHVTFYIKGDVTKSPIWSFFRNNGWIGVDIFFVLTGFLVTILLLDERRIHKKFSIKGFTVRRILRIWPLYFLAILVGFFVIPYVFEHLLANSAVNHSQEISNNIPWYLFFLGNWNVVLHGYGSFRAISQLWAISVDQQFYILWPLLLLFMKNLKSSLIVCFFIILFSVGTRFYLVNTGVQHPGIYTNTFARLDTFMMGAILALILFYKPAFLDKFSKFYTSTFQILSIFLLGLFLYFSSLNNTFAIRNGVFGYLVISIISTYIILFCIKTNTFLVRSFSQKPMRYLGKISYGLYIWHIIVLEFLFYLLQNQDYDLFLIILGLPLVILLAHLSFKFFEKPFLNLKLNFNQKK